MGDNVTWIEAIPLLKTFTPSFFTLSSPTQILPAFIHNILSSHLPPSSSCSASVLLWRIHRVGVLQWHRVSDGLWRPLSEVDRVPGLRYAVPGPRAGRPQLLQEPRPGVQPLVLLQAKLWSHRMGLLRLPPGYDCGPAGDFYNDNKLLFYSTSLNYRVICDPNKTQ